MATTAASVDDATMTEPVRQGLARRGMTPAEDYVDCGYTSAKLILQARADGIDLIGPVKQAGGHQAHSANGYAATDFHIDWETRQPTCPQSKTSSRWIDTRENGEPRVHIDFYRAGCPTCPAKALCTTAAYRGITLRTANSTRCWKPTDATSTPPSGSSVTTPEPESRARCPRQ